MRSVLVTLLMICLFPISVLADDIPEELAKALRTGASNEPEKTFISSEVVTIAVSCNNVVVGSSPVVVEIREGGCMGKLKARVTVEAGDTLSNYSTKGDFVKITCTDTSLPMKYQYDVGFNFPTTTDARERIFSASGKSRVFGYFYNNQGGKTNILVKATEGMNVQSDGVVSPKYFSYYSDTADKVTVKASDPANTSYHGNVRFFHVP